MEKLVLYGEILSLNFEISSIPFPFFPFGNVQKSESVVQSKLQLPIGKKHLTVSSFECIEATSRRLDWGREENAGDYVRISVIEFYRVRIHQHPSSYQ